MLNWNIIIQPISAQLLALHTFPSSSCRQPTFHPLMVWSVRPWWLSWLEDARALCQDTRNAVVISWGNLSNCLRSAVMFPSAPRVIRDHLLQVLVWARLGHCIKAVLHPERVCWGLDSGCCSWYGLGVWAQVMVLLITGSQVVHLPWSCWPTALIL